MEFNFGSTGRQQTKESLASDKLQKAIDRNRAKQYKRSTRNNFSDELDLSQASSRNSGRLPGSRLPGSRPNLEASSHLRGKSSTPRQAMGRSATDRSTPPNTSTSRRPAPGSGRASATSRMTSSRLGKSGVTSERKSVGSADSVEFATSVNRSIRKAPAKASYAAIKTKSRPLKKVSGAAKVTDKKTLYTIRFLWIFLGFLTLRLVFSGGGVIDFYTNRNLLLSKVQEFENTKISNASLIKEIKRIKIDSKYQKKLVRDHLGFIASDEYVILFPKEKS